MKVLQVLNEIKASGAETMIATASHHFKEHNYEVHVLSTGEVVGSYASNLEELNYKIKHLPYKRYWAFTSPMFLLKYYLYLKRNKFDVIHIHPERGYFAYALIAKFAGVQRVVRTVHHIFPQGNNLKGYILKPIKTFQRRVLKKMFKVVFTSNSSSGLNNEINTYKSKNLYLPNWYDEKKYSYDRNYNKNIIKESLGIKKDAIIYISLGGNWEYKNYDLIIEAVNTIKDAVYIQIGPNNEDLVKLKNKLKANNVILLGKVNDPIPYLKSSDFYIMPSKLEGFGVAAVEAMACGLPCVLSNRPALIDFKKLSNKIIFTEPNLVGVKNAISTSSKLTEDEKLEISENMSKIAYENFSSKIVVNQLIKLYENKN